MRLCRFEKQKRYILNWDEDGMEKGEYICYETDDTTAKLAFKSNLKKQYEIKQNNEVRPHYSEYENLEFDINLDDVVKSKYDIKVEGYTGLTVLLTENYLYNMFE